MSYNKDKTGHQQPENALQTTVFPLDSVAGKPATLRFSGQDMLSDGGALLPGEVDGQIGLTEAMAGCLSDTRDQRYVSHQFRELLAGRVYGIGCGYEDANDSQRLKTDPVFKMCNGRLPYSGPAERICTGCQALRRKMKYALRMACVDTTYQSRLSRGIGIRQEYI